MKSASSLRVRRACGGFARRAAGVTESKLSEGLSVCDIGRLLAAFRPRRCSLPSRVSKPILYQKNSELLRPAPAQHFQNLLRIRLSCGGMRQGFARHHSMARGVGLNCNLRFASTSSRLLERDFERLFVCDPLFLAAYRIVGVEHLQGIKDRPHVAATLPAGVDSERHAHHHDPGPDDDHPGFGR